LVDALTGRGDGVVVLDDLSTGRLENLEHVIESGLVEFVQGSVLDEKLLDDCMSAVDACFHLASTVGVQLVVDRPLDTLLGNVRGVDAVMASAVKHGRRLLFTSTSEIYGKNSQQGLHEEADRILGSPFKTRWTYANTKTFGEMLAHSYCRERGAEMIVARLFNAVGPRQTGYYGMVLPRFVKQALEGRDLTVHGNGTQTRCFTHVLDTVHALVLLFDSDRAVGNVYNVGSPTEVAIVELARRVIEHTGSSSTIKLVPYEEAYGDGFEELGRRVPDTAALERLTGWKPARTVDEAIEDVIMAERGSHREARVG
jgi:UDP-glucose 4-epimerase